jgi:hypothetical protein
LSAQVRRDAAFINPHNGIIHRVSDPYRGGDLYSYCGHRAFAADPDAEIEAEVDDWKRERANAQAALADPAKMAEEIASVRQSSPELDDEETRAIVEMLASMTDLELADEMVSEPPSMERVAVRTALANWLGRFLAEGDSIALEEIGLVVSCLSALRSPRHEVTLAMLRGMTARANRA